MRAQTFQYKTNQTGTPVYHFQEPDKWHNQQYQFNH